MSFTSIVKNEVSKLETNELEKIAELSAIISNGAIIDKEIKIFNNWQDLVFYGGEDYQIIATIEEGLLKKLHGYTIIGEVEKAEKGICD